MGIISFVKEGVSGLKTALEKRKQTREIKLRSNANKYNQQFNARQQKYELKGIRKQLMKEDLNKFKKVLEKALAQKPSSNQSVPIQFRRQLRRLGRPKQMKKGTRIARTRNPKVIYIRQPYQQGLQRQNNIPMQQLQNQRAYFNPNQNPINQMLPRDYFVDTDMITGQRVIRKRRLG